MDCGQGVTDSGKPSFKKTLFCDKCQTSSDPPPLRVTKNHPPFFTQKTLSEELKNTTTWSGLRPFPPKIFSSKNTF